MVRFIDGAPEGDGPKHIVEISCGIAGTYATFDVADRARALIEGQIRDMVKESSLRVVEMRSVVVEEGQDGDTDNSGGDR